MKIYTKTGDKGETSLIGGKRVPKYHPRIEAYGTIDELISFVAVLRDATEIPEWQEILIEIQDKLMVCASILASDCDDCKVKIPKLTEADIEYLEKQIDEMTLVLPPLHNFILPGGHLAVSYCHVCRTVCRRAERLILRLEDEFLYKELTIKYINRLSDYFFTLSRLLSNHYKVKEISWLPNF